MNDNTTAHKSMEYDNKVIATIPFYNFFQESIIDLLKSSGVITNKWLDTGCGTGNLINNASKIFSNTEFTLADPSIEMIHVAKDKINHKSKITFITSDSQGLVYPDNTFDVITAIQCHHYLDKKGRQQAVENCFRMLKPNGIFITFENIMPLSEKGINIGLKRWEDYQVCCGKTLLEAKKHMDRFGKEYFPISIVEHLNLLNEAGFKSTEILWASYMQAGFYAIK